VPAAGDKSSLLGVVGVQPGQRPHRYPLTRHEAEVAQQLVERAAELARDSHARTRHAAVLVKDGSLLAWGTNGVPFPGEDHCYCKVGELGHHDQCWTHAEQRAITLARQDDGWRKLPGTVCGCPGPQRPAALTALPGRARLRLMTQRWRTLQHVMISPSRIGEIAQAVLVLIQFEQRMTGHPSGSFTASGAGRR
jgi:hypothetical protein